MSVESTARLLPAPAPSERQTPRLRPVSAPARRRRPKLAFALIALGGALAIGAGQMVLSLAITHDSFVLADLTSQQRELDLQTRALQDEVTGLSSPQHLAAEADALGMVVAGSASYLRLSDAAVLGANAPAGWASTIDPKGNGAVSNLLLGAAESAAPPANEEQTTGGVDPNLPPAITDGLPSPTTR